MENKRQELLEYIRLLYERQSSASSKAGMTLWAVLAGVVYLFWNTFEKLLNIQDMSVFKDSFYYYFGNVFVALISLVMLVSYRGVLKNKRDLDYRLYKRDSAGFGFVFTVLAFLLVSVFFSHYSEVLGDNKYYALQRLVNFWFFASVLVLVGVSLAFKVFKESKNDMPSPDNFFVLEDSWFQKAFYGLLLISVLGLFVGNLVVVAIGFYSSGYDSIAIVVAFNLSLVFLAAFFLFSIKSEKDRLGFLSRLERDIVIHDIEPRVILERLQDELLGNYIGDWICEKLKEVRGRAEEVVVAARKCDDVIEEVESIDAGYERERRGRLDEYLECLAVRENQFVSVANPVIKWFEDVSIHLRISSDDFVKSLIKESLSDMRNFVSEVDRESLSAREKVSGLKGSEGQAITPHP